LIANIKAQSVGEAYFTINVNSGDEILKSEINFNLKHSKFYAELGINAKNQAGLMAYVMGVFKEFNIKIVSAKVQTIKDRTRNLFLIQKSGALDLNYKKIVNLLINKGE